MHGQTVTVAIDPEFPRGFTTTMLFSPLRKAVIAGAGMLAIGAAGGVAVHAASTASPATTPTATSSASPAPDHARDCKLRARLRGAAEQVLQITASVTGLTHDQVLDQLRAGRTLDQIAGSKASTIEQQSLAKLKDRLDRAVQSGRITADRENTMLDKARSMLEKLMSTDLSGRIPGAGSMGAKSAACGLNGARRTLLHDVVTVTAQKTGLSEQQVLDQLRAGRSIDDITGPKAAEIKAAVLQMEDQRLGSLLDKLMSHQGLGRGAGSRSSSSAGGAGQQGSIDATSFDGSI